MLRPSSGRCRATHQTQGCTHGPHEPNSAPGCLCTQWCSKGWTLGGALWEGPWQASAPTSPSALTRTVRKLSPVPQLFWVFHTSVEGGLWATPAPAAHTWGHRGASPSMLARSPVPRSSSQLPIAAPGSGRGTTCQGTNNPQIHSGHGLSHQQTQAELCPAAPGLHSCESSIPVQGPPAHTAWPPYHEC